MPLDCRFRKTKFVFLKAVTLGTYMLGGHGKAKVKLLQTIGNGEGLKDTEKL